MMIRLHLSCAAGGPVVGVSSFGSVRPPARSVRARTRSTTATAWTVGVRALSAGQLGLEVGDARRRIFENGFAILPGMWSKGEVAAGGAGLVVGSEQEEALKSLLMEPVGVLSREHWVHAPGHRCTDAAASPEPDWLNSWHIAGLECEDLRRPPWSATLVVSLSDRNVRMFCGGVAVFPRSHWLLHDWFANSNSEQLRFPQPCDVPAAVPTELRLDCGDMALLHPLLAYTIAPNSCRADDGWKMWCGWLSMESFLTDHITRVEEVMQLETEEGKAQLGDWQSTMTSLTTDQLSLATSLKIRTAPRDLLAWHLRTSAVQFMKDGQWSNALSVLLRRAGLRPTCYWTALEAGRCCMKSAPAGQLGGRAGRKCTLEDGERFLERAIEIAPGWPLAYAELMRCLALMGRGREQEISGVMEAMKRRCSLQQLCLRYPTVSGILEECWNDCEALCYRYTAGERA